MIQANELRIGNLFIGYDDKVFEWTLGHFNLLWCDVLIDEFIKSPIAINEEWLIKFGFKIESYDEGNYYTKKGEYDFDLDGHFDYHWSDGSWIKIKYVHQLQNLYFARTQTELTLKDA